MPSKRYVYPDTLGDTFRAGRERIDALHQSLRGIQDRVDTSHQLLDESREALRKANRQMTPNDSKQPDRK